MRDWYQAALKIPGLRGYVRELYRMYQVIKPADEKTLREAVKKVLKGNILLAAALLGCFISFRGATVYLYGILIMAAVVTNRQWVRQRLQKEEKRLLEQLEKYLGDVRHYYHTGGLIEEAVLNSLEEAPYEIALHMYQIYDILVEGDKEKELRYRQMAPNKFLTTFLALCQITMEYGDSVRNDKSLFLTNLNHLREEIRIELLKREKIAYVFSGLIWVCLLPVFFLKIIENWGIDNLPELEDYYHGDYGIIVSALIFIGTWGAYELICSLREYEVFWKNHRILKKLSEMPWIHRKIKGWIFTHPKWAQGLSQKLQQWEAGKRLPEFIVESAIYGSLSGGAFFIIICHIGILKGAFFYISLVLGLAGGIAAGGAGFFIPWIFLQFRLFFGKREKEDEVLQFHSIILMLMYLKRMNVETILTWLENFSCSFRKSIQECVDDFAYDNEAALRRLREREPFLPFVRLVENLEACDRIGVLEAFDEIAGQRTYFLEKRKQDNEIAISEKGAIARVVAYLPMVLTLLLYLIVPFVLESIIQLGGYMSQLGGM